MLEGKSPLALALLDAASLPLEGSDRMRDSSPISGHQLTPGMRRLVAGYWPNPGEIWDCGQYPGKAKMIL